jgi:hypothetical protein
MPVSPAFVYSCLSSFFSVGDFIEQKGMSLDFQPKMIVGSSESLSDIQRQKSKSLLAGKYLPDTAKPIPVRKIPLSPHGEAGEEHVGQREGYVIHGNDGGGL